ncbi:hypothetical protein BGY98DRAFT_951393 [Russula aff. rugulosa BPL654]|nr:hypothetical protein BGY98DRAFT_951393 [Russula aff. rugulosa BPL654]
MIGCEIHYHISKQGADRNAERSGEESGLCSGTLARWPHIFSSSGDSSVQYMCVQAQCMMCSMTDSCRRLGSEPISPRRGSCRCWAGSGPGTRDDQGEAHRDEGRPRRHARRSGTTTRAVTLSFGLLSVAASRAVTLLSFVSFVIVTPHTRTLSDSSHLYPSMATPNNMAPTPYLEVNPPNIVHPLTSNPQSLDSSSSRWHIRNSWNVRRPNVTVMMPPFECY